MRLLPPMYCITSLVSRLLFSFVVSHILYHTCFIQHTACVNCIPYTVSHLLHPIYYILYTETHFLYRFSWIRSAALLMPSVHTPRGSTGHQNTQTTRREQVGTDALIVGQVYGVRKTCCASCSEYQGEDDTPKTRAGQEEEKASIS